MQLILVFIWSIGVGLLFYSWSLQTLKLFESAHYAIRIAQRTHLYEAVIAYAIALLHVDKLMQETLKRKRTFLCERNLPEIGTISFVYRLENQGLLQELVITVQLDQSRGSGSYAYRIPYS